MAAAAFRMPSRARAVALGAAALGIGIGIGIGLGLGGCGRPSDEGERGAARGLILVSIDTLRADRLGAYGAIRPTSPELDRLAARGARFERVVAEAPWTLPSHVTMLSGLHPATHGVDEPGERPGAATPLLAEVLRDAGFATFGFTDGGFVSEAQGFDRGFLSFRAERRGLAAQLADAREVIEAADGRPYFVLVHTYDVHCPYDPAEEVLARFRSPGSVPLETAGRCGNPHYNAMELSAGERRYLADAYDASVREADVELGRFVRFLEESGALERAFLVVTSDHGEELFEHGRIGHERTVHREVLEVPLLVAGPGVAPRVVRGTAGLADLVPTVLELLDVAPPAGLDGRSWAAELRGEDAGGRAAEASAAPGGTSAAPGGRMSELAWKERLRSWLRGDEHLIVDVGTGARRLYDLARDPAETRDLAAERPDRVRALAAELGAFAATLGPPRPVAGRAVDEAETLSAELRALGYGG